jgi:hypothetical protein
MRRWVSPGVVLALGAAAIVSIVLTRGTHPESIPFNDTEWRRASPLKDDTRYRMSDDLVGKIREEGWSRNKVLTDLGATPGPTTMQASCAVGTGFSGDFYDLVVTFDHLEHATDARLVPH